jgi:hypothetical protein
MKTRFSHPVEIEVLVEPRFKQKIAIAVVLMRRKARA